MVFLVSCLDDLACRAEPPSPPNIVIIFADDLGWGDLGCYGHPSIRTPYLDRMAAEGMRFTDFYSAGEVCSPSRAALLTGRYPIRSGMCHDRYRVLRRDSTGGLPGEEITLAEALKTRGYATACIGKWHLGNYANVAAHHPLRHGFDHYFGLPHSNDMNPTPGRAEGGRRPARSASRLVGGAAMAQRASSSSAPPTRRRSHAVTPRRPSGSSASTRTVRSSSISRTASPTCRCSPPPRRPARAAAGSTATWSRNSTGASARCSRRSAARGLSENTLVFFTSDNGPWLTQGEAGGSAGLLREGKGSTWEGGMREPGIAWWPSRIKPGAVTHELASTMDLFATALALAGAEVPTDRAIDGVDMSPILLGEGPSRRDVFFYYRGATLYAARKGPFKAHFITQGAYGAAGPEKHDPPLLFHLAHDPAERFNVAAAHPEVIADVAEEVERHRATIVPVKSQFEETMEGR